MRTRRSSRAAAVSGLSQLVPLDESADEDDADASNHNRLDEPEADEVIESEYALEEVVDNDITLQQVGEVNA